MLIILLPAAFASAATQYLYDDLGRLILVANSDGSATVYEHDSNGNLLAINQWAGAGPVIANFSPAYGHTGTQITIFGTGFDETPAENTVTIGGAAATVSSATTTTLTAAIPQGATTGPVTVAVDSVTATSSQSLVVLKPTITSFTPSVVAPGASVTLTGTSLKLEPTGTSLAVGNSTVTLTSLTNTQAVFSAPSSGSGRITVNTSYGEVTSATNLVIVPNAIGAANVVASAEIEASGAAQSLSINQQSKYAVLSFDATAGQFYSIQTSGLSTTPPGVGVAYQLFSPAGTSISSGSVSSTLPSIHLPVIPTTGTYLLSFASGSNSSVQITAALELNSTLTGSGTTLSASTSAVRQSKRFIFNATAGDDFGFALTGLSISPSSPNYNRVWIYRPDGYYVNTFYCYTTSAPGCSANLLNVPLTGAYSVFIEPQSASTMSFGVTLSQDVTGTLSPGTPFSVNLAEPGRMALLSFTATAGQAKALYLNQISTTPSGKSVTMEVYNPSGTAVYTATNTSQATINLTNLLTGTYSVVLIPQDAATASAQVTLANGVTATLPSDGSSQSFSTTVPRQNGYFTFSANAGDDFGLALTALSLSPASPNYVRVWVYRPDGYYVSTFYCYTTATPGCSANLFNLPLTGTYRVDVESQGASTMSFALTLSQDVTGTLSAGTPLSVDLAFPGRMALLSFAATAGDTKALHLGSISTTPSGKSVTMEVYNPSGTAVYTATNTSQATINLTNLVTGTYSVVLVPQDAATASAQVTLGNGVTGTLPTDGSSQSFSTTVVRQNGYFTFSATAGDDLGLAMTGLSLSPSSPNYVRIAVTRPDGYSYTSPYCYTTSEPGCTVNLINLPVTGTYKVNVEPQGPSTMSFSLTLSQDLTGTLTTGTPVGVTLSTAGQQALLSFTATAGQSAALSMSAISTIPSGKAMTMRLYNPSGNEVGLGSGATSTTQTTVNLTNLVVGTYTVLVTPQDAATGSTQVLIQ